MPILLMGGNEFRPDCAVMDREILVRLRRRPARVVIVPTAAAHEGPRQAADHGVRYFRELGASAQAAMVLSRADAQTTQLAAPLAAADVAYLTGGDPAHLLDALRDTPFLAALHALVDRGGWVIGSSAGAMALGQWLSYRGDAPEPALGFVPRVVVLPHHEGAREHAAPRGLEPGAVALGIDSATGCASVEGSNWEVLGTGAVRVYSGDGAAGGPYRRGERFSLPAA